MPEDTPIPLLAADLVDAVERHVRGDPRILTAHVQGFPPARPGDLYADVILHLGCNSKATCEAIVDGARDWLAPVTHVVATRSAGPFVFPGTRCCVTEDGIRIDIRAYDAEFAHARPHGRILKETPGHFRTDAPPPKVWTPCPEDVADRILRFWSEFALIGRAIERDAVSFGYFAYLELYRSAFGVLAQRGPGRGHLPFQNIILSPEDDRLLSSAVRFESLTPETLAREYLNLGRLVATHAPAICQTAGVQYPLALEEAVLRRVRAELRMYGIVV